jgi:hypothetical protein
MLYRQDIFLSKFCKKIKEEPIDWGKLLDTKFSYELPKNSIIDMSSLKFLG